MRGIGWRRELYYRGRRRIACFPEKITKDQNRARAPDSSERDSRGLPATASSRSAASSGTCRRLRLTAPLTRTRASRPVASRRTSSWRSSTARTAAPPCTAATAASRSTGGGSQRQRGRWTEALSQPNQQARESSYASLRTLPRQVARLSQIARPGARRAQTVGLPRQHAGP